MSNIKDPPAHWYECQLIHYGLRPSKTKSVAKLRLLDAFNEGSTVVPQSLQNLETELRKQWNKIERQTRKERKEMTSTTSAAAQGQTAQQTIKEPGRAAKQGDRVAASKGAGKKRKLNDDTSDVTAALSNARAAAVTKLDRAKAHMSGPSAMQDSARKQRAEGTTAKRAKSAPAFARRSIPSERGSHCESERSALTAPASFGAHLPRSRQTARRSRPFNPGTRFDSRPSLTTMRAREAWDIPSGARTERSLSTSCPVDEIDEDDVVMQDASFNSHDEERGVFESVKQEDACPSYPQGSDLVGVVNGMYNVRTSINGEWDEYNGHQSTITLTFHGDELWGSYDFGMFNGVIRMTERRRDSSDDTVDFQWRGIENSEHIISYNDSRQTGQIAFDGGGVVSGTFHGMYREVSFQGLRVDCRQTGDEQTYSTLHKEWDSYSEEAFEIAQESVEKQLVDAQHSLGIACQANGQVKEALEQLEHVVRVQERLAEDHPSRVASQHALASAYQANGQIAQAVELLKHVVAIKQRMLRVDDPSRIASENNLAYFLEQREQPMEPDANKLAYGTPHSEKGHTPWKEDQAPVETAEDAVRERVEHEQNHCKLLYRCLEGLGQSVAL
ncbi:hypothetical protein LTR94_022126 [Friedmanniomyces endolithicus]|nr:hypothetical protein LTR94_022126 [Friedmanniomyces endolithicus]